MTCTCTARASGQSVAGRAGPVVVLCGSATCSGPLALWPSGRGPQSAREIGRNENAWPPDCSRSLRRSERECEVTIAHAMRCGAVERPSAQSARGRRQQRVNPRQFWCGAIRLSRMPSSRRRRGGGGGGGGGGAWHRRAKNRHWGGRGNWQEPLSSVQTLAGMRKGGGLFHQPSRNSPT
jgi:hypothetical protein